MMKQSMIIMCRVSNLQWILNSSFSLDKITYLSKQNIYEIFYKPFNYVLNFDTLECYSPPVIHICFILVFPQFVLLEDYSRTGRRASGRPPWRGCPSGSSTSGHGP